MLSLRRQLEAPVPAPARPAAAGDQIRVQGSYPPLESPRRRPELAVIPGNCELPWRDCELPRNDCWLPRMAIAPGEFATASNEGGSVCTALELRAVQGPSSDRDQGSDGHGDPSLSPAQSGGRKRELATPSESRSGRGADSDYGRPGRRSRKRTRDSPAAEPGVTVQV